MVATAEALRALAELVDALQAPGAVFGTWVPSSPRPDGSASMPYVEYGELEGRFRAAVGRGGWMRVGFDWSSWAATDEARAFEADPARIAAATPEQLARLLTWIIRGDRFSEGTLLGAFERGHLAAIGRRAQTLLDDPVALAASMAEDAGRADPG